MGLEFDGVNGIIKNTTSDGDVTIKGNDGGSEISLLTFDVSAEGVATFNSTVAMTSFAATAASTITTSDNTTQLTLKSTDADAAVGPVLTLHRQSSSPGDDDIIGRINFIGEDSGGTDTTYGRIETVIMQESNGSEDATMEFRIMKGGTERNVLELDRTQVIINEDSQDIDFRVESNGDANMLFVDGGQNLVRVGNNAQTNSLIAGNFDLVVGNESSGATGLAILATNNENSYVGFFDQDNSGSFRGTIHYNHTNDYMQIYTNGTIGIRQHSNQVLSASAGIALGVGTANTASNVLDDYEEGTYTPTVDDENGGSYGLSTNSDTLQYTKIGRVVTVQGMIAVTSESSPNGILRLSLPFTAPSLVDDTDFALHAMGLSNNGSTIAGQKFLFVQPGSYAYLYALGDDGSANYIQHDEVDTNFQFHVNIRYLVS